MMNCVWRCSLSCCFVHNVWMAYSTSVWKVIGVGKTNECENGSDKANTPYGISSVKFAPIDKFYRILCVARSTNNGNNKNYLLCHWQPHYCLACAAVERVCDYIRKATQKHRECMNILAKHMFLKTTVMVVILRKKKSQYCNRKHILCERWALWVLHFT